MAKTAEKRKQAQNELDNFYAKKEKERIQPLGYVTLSNPIRANAKETFSYFPCSNSSFDSCE